MDRDQAREYIRGQLGSYLQGRGINTRKPFRCLNPEHPDGTPSMNYDRKRQKCHCFACNADYDTFDLVGIEYGLTDPKAIFEKAYSLFNLDIQGGKKDAAHDFTSQNRKKNRPAAADPQEAEPPAVDYMDYYRERMEHIQECGYLKKRGISPETAARFMLGYDPAWRHPKAPAVVPATPRLIIPTGRSSYLARDTRDNLDEAAKQYAKSKVGSVQLYNAQALDREPAAVFITEGEIDALSIVEAGGEAVGLGSAGNYKRLVERLEKKRPAAVLILALDNDKAGRDTTEKLRAELDRLKVKNITAELYGEAKDANEALVRDRSALERAVAEAKDAAAAEAQAEKEAEKAEYMQASVSNHLDKFLQNIQESATAPFFPTGFSQLDGILDGGLYAGLYIIGAISSLGKTTFCLQICDQIAAAGHDVIIFSLEMSKDELIAKSVSRHSYIEAMKTQGGKKTAKTTRGILAGGRWLDYGKEDLDNIDAAINAYSEYADHLFIHEGVGNIGVEQIKETVEKHIRVTGNRPMILIDYLQIIAPYDPRATDKQNTDKAVLELKRMSRDCGIPVIGISSFNRENYTAPVNMASFKESGAVEYSSDVLIGLQYEGMDWHGGESEKERNKRIRQLMDDNIASGKAGKPQKIQVKVLKNRNGSKGNAFIEFVSMFNYFKEQGEAGSGSGGKEEPKKETYKQLTADEWLEFKDSEGTENPFLDF